MPAPLHHALMVVVFVAGAVVVLATLGSALRTVVLPRGVSVRLGRAIGIALRLLFKVVIRPSTSYERRDRLLASYAPLLLMGILTAWMVDTILGFTAMLWSVGVQPLRAAFMMSLSSIVTLGFIVPHDLPTTMLAFAEAALGLFLLALLITFLPTMYSLFHTREQGVAGLETQAGSPPSAPNILLRLHRLERLDYRRQIWTEWERWFAVVELSHTQYPTLPFFRSPQPEQSWVTASGAVLDAAAISASCLDLPRDIEAELCIRAGYVALRRIATLFRLPHDPDPAPDDPIAVSRDEFDEVWESMAAEGVQLKRDQEQAWKDFAGWRVNYDTVLIRLATLTEAPIAPWSSDRSLVGDRALTFIERIRQ